MSSSRTEPGGFLPVVSGVFSGVLISALAVVAFALTRTLPLAMLTMSCVGFGLTVCNVGINMLLQSMAPDELRGRVVSFFTSARFGFDAVGGLLAGFIATLLGARQTLLIEGSVLLLFLVFLRLRRYAEALK